MARIMLDKKKAEAPADHLTVQGAADSTTQHPAIIAVVRLLVQHAARGHLGEGAADRGDSISKAEKAIAQELRNLVREHVGKGGTSHSISKAEKVITHHLSELLSAEDAADSASISTRDLRRFSQGRRARAPTAPTELLSVQDAADYAKVSTQTIRRWVKGGLRIYRAGRQLRIDKSDLVDFISFNFDE